MEVEKPPGKAANSDLKDRVWIESKNLWWIAFPSMLTKVTHFGTLVATQAGTLGN